jgi:hypothetical protein
MSSEEGVKTSKKRVREEDGDGNADAATEGLSSETKDLYHAIKAACTAKSFNEAVDLCTKALDEEHLSKAFRTKFLLARSSIYSQMENMFPMAIKDAKQAILLSPTHAMVSLSLSGVRQGLAYKVLHRDTYVLPMPFIREVTKPKRSRHLLKRRLSPTRQVN